MRSTWTLGVVWLLAAGTLALAEEPAREQQPGTADAAPRLPVRVTIGKETTYVTGPLRPDGYVDYLAALNEIASKDVTPENNAAVLIWQILGPTAVPESLRPQFFAMLHMAEPPEAGDYFVPLEQFAARLPGQPAGTDADWNRALDAQQEQALRRPWSQAEFPELAQWIATNEQALDRLVAATRRSKYYAPYVSESNHLLGCELLTTQATRELARALVARATRRMGERDFSAAWDNLAATHRLAQLVAQGRFFLEGLVAAAVDRLADVGDWALAGAEGLSAADARRFGEARSKLPALDGFVDQIDIGERLVFLDVVCDFACGGSLSIGNLSTGLTVEHEKPTAWQRLSRRFTTAIVDWDIPLRRGNAWYDRYVAALRLPTPGERIAAIALLAQADRSRFDQIKDWSFLIQEQVIGGARQAFGNRLFDILLALMAIDGTLAIDVEARTAMERDLALLSYALAAYRIDHGMYPAQLAELVPIYIAQIPDDRFADAPLHYRRTDSGCLLYSIGVNREDDGGHDLNDDAAGDDLVVRLERKSGS